MWNSASTLSALAWWSLVLTAVFGGLAVLTGLLGGVAATRSAEIEKREADSQIAEANARAAAASEEAAKANERLHRAQQVRRLTKPQADALMPLLKSDLFQREPQPRLQVAAVDDAEAQLFAMDFQKLFEACGVNIYPTEGGLPNKCSQVEVVNSDLMLVVGSLEAREENQPFVHFQRAMKALGFELGLELDPKRRPNEAMLAVLMKRPV